MGCKTNTACGQDEIRASSAVKDTGIIHQITDLWGGGKRVRSTPLSKLYRYERHQRVWFLNNFGLKIGIDFTQFEFLLVMDFVHMK